MRKTLFFLMTLALATALVGGSAEAAIYEGGSSGVKAELHVKGGQIVFAKVRVTLYCLDQRSHERHRRRFGVAWNTSRRFPAVREYHSRPIDLSGGGRFFESNKDNAEAGYSSEELFAGRVSYWMAAGRFHYANEYRTPHRREKCQTGSFPKSHKRAVVHFRAPRL